MKKISKAIVLFLMILSLTLLSSCKGKGNDDKDKDGDTPKLPGINTEGGVELPIIPYE